MGLSIAIGLLVSLSGMLLSDAWLLVLWMRSRAPLSKLELEVIQNKQVVAITLIFVLGIIGTICARAGQLLPELAIQLVVIHNIVFGCLCLWAIGAFIVNFVEWRADMKQLKLQQSQKGPKTGQLKTKSKRNRGMH